jgi:hypothetical protein
LNGLNSLTPGSPKVLLVPGRHHQVMPNRRSWLNIQTAHGLRLVEIEKAEEIERTVAAICMVVDRTVELPSAPRDAHFEFNGTA